MKGRPINELVFEHMFAAAGTRSPASWDAFVTRSLIPEVRHEVQAFYGHLQTLEAKYPGLDYTHPIHRVRLSRWPWHRRLFRAFDALGLTDAEIAGLTKWEGTKWAKEKYETESGTKIMDSTADDIQQTWIEPEERWSVVSQARATPSLLESAADEDEELDDEDEDDGDDDDDDDADLQTDDESSILQSMTMATADSLRERTAQTSVPAANDTAEAWEQWLKTAIETGELPHVTEQIARISHGPEAAPLTPDDIFPPRMLVAARAGMWHEVPEFLRDLIRQSLENDEQRLRNLAEQQWPQSLQSVSSQVASSSSGRRNYSSLRLPGSSATSVTGSSPNSRPAAS
jgi:hypothetical protein